jgi:hypothetical protein
MVSELGVAKLRLLEDKRLVPVTVVPELTVRFELDSTKEERLGFASVSVLPTFEVLRGIVPVATEMELIGFVMMGEDTCVTEVERLEMTPPES